MDENWVNIKEDYYIFSKSRSRHRINKDKVYISIRCKNKTNNNICLSIFLGSKVAKLLDFNHGDYVDTFHYKNNLYKLKICKSYPNIKTTKNNKLYMSSNSTTVTYQNVINHINLKKQSTFPIDFDIDLDRNLIFNLENFKA